ncbi:hypothetical protein MEA186_13177 [Mesorhizobium amorphae CCNWGS0123]|uniref:Uncharacterized protein n=1 Tax=Mesorhizobium amorphae CCNWGS0123 TaxID=1082933 RepID=G6Y9L3_9HYPH|nr:hypothetical protein MEA186_13177 [Mesorhizobium amorphae CCNWGS0123]
MRCKEQIVEDFFSGFHPAISKQRSTKNGLIVSQILQLVQIISENPVELVRSERLQAE